MALSHQWDEADLRWLKQLAEQVPLAEGRMEIHTSLFAATFRLVLCLAFTALFWSMAAAGLWQGEARSLFPFMLAGGCAILGSVAVWAYATRTLRAILRRPEFVLSKAGLAIGERLLPWKDLSALEYDCKNRRGYRSHTCKIALRDGSTLSLDLDTTSLRQGRVMLLIDFYATGAQLP